MAWSLDYIALFALKKRINNAYPSALYEDHFGVKNEGIGPENTFYWNIYDE